MSSPRLYKQTFSLGGGILVTGTALASHGVTLPQSVINVDSTAGFPTSGTIYVITLVNSFYTQQLVTYTGTTATTFTGCTGGTGIMQTGYSISYTGNIVNGSWTCPAGIRYVIVTGCGGGGGGGGGASASAPYPGSPSLFAGGGSGGHPAFTTSQIINVTPGVVYSVSIGIGGPGGTANCVANRVNGGGGYINGNPGFDGSSSIFGSVVFPGGKGGRGGSLIRLSDLTFSSGSDCDYAETLNSIASPDPLIATIQKSADIAPFTKAGATQGAALSIFRGTDTYAHSGGGTAGGTSNNTMSAGGNGGDGALGKTGHNFAFGGAHGSYGGGGGGGGGGEPFDFNNTGTGAFGGWGGSGFIEVSWMA